MKESQDAELIGSLLALVAHDLRNPLSALHSNVGFLDSLVKNQDARDALADVSASCGSLKHIIDNLELLGLFVQGKSAKLDRAPVSLFDVTTDVIARVEGIAQSYGATLSLDPAGRGVRVLAHREMLVRSLGNVLFNAIQHGGGAVPIGIHISSDGESGVIVCTDGGSALAEPLRVSAFTAEGQLSAKGDALGRYGRGLGLFSAHIAAQMAGAEVRALSSESGKNCFELRAKLA